MDRRMTAHGPLPATGWYQLGLDPARRKALIAEQYRTQSTDRKLFAKTLTDLAEIYTRDDGCEFAAVAWDPASGEYPHAIILLSVESWKGTDFDIMLGRLEVERPGDIGPRDVQRRELAQGPAARVRVIAETGTDRTGRQVVSDVQQYWLPLPDRGTMLIASAATGRLEYGDHLGVVLDTLMEHLTLD
jgi:hypothetical protein